MVNVLEVSRYFLKLFEQSYWCRVAISIINKCRQDDVYKILKLFL